MINVKSILKFGLLGICAATLLSATALQAAEDKEYKPKVVSKALFDGTLDGLKDKKVIIKHFTLPPGYKGGAHYHPAHVFVYVLEGELSIDIAGKRQTFKAGELYKEKVGEVMVGGNASASKSTNIVVFQIGDVDKPMMIKAGKK